MFDRDLVVKWWDLIAVDLVHSWFCLGFLSGTKD